MEGSPPAFQLENDACDTLSPTLPLRFQGDTSGACSAACSMTALVVFAMSSVVVGDCAHALPARSRAAAEMYNFFMVICFWNDMQWVAFKRRFY